MDDDGPTVTAYLILFAVMILIDMVAYGFGAAIENLRSEDLDIPADDEDAAASFSRSTIRKSEKLRRILEFPTRFINTLQLVTLLVNMLFGIMYVNVLGRAFNSFVGSFVASGAVSTGISYVLAVLIVMYVVMTLGVLIPRKVGTRYPKAFAMGGVDVVSFIIAILGPFTGAVRFTAKGILRIFGFHWDVAENDVTEEEIKSMVSEGQEQGVLQDSEADMISNIFEFSDKEARDIMTNRQAMVCIDGNTTLSEAVDFMLDMNNTRFPVYLDNIDHIIGILHIRDAMKKLAEHVDDDTPLRKTRGLLRSPKNVPETRNIDTLFREMQTSKTQMVIVIDEYGQTAGLVSMEDIIEEIVGNIMDEYDEEEDYIEATSNEDEFIIEGKAPLEELEERFGLGFEDAPFETVNGLLISRLDRIPEENEDFETEIDDYSFRILSVKDHMIQSVLVKKIRKDETEGLQDDKEDISK